MGNYIGAAGAAGKGLILTLLRVEWAVSLWPPDTVGCIILECPSEVEYLQSIQRTTVGNKKVHKLL